MVIGIWWVTYLSSWYNALTCAIHLLIKSFESNNIFPFFCRVCNWCRIKLELVLVAFYFTLEWFCFVLFFRSNSSIIVGLHLSFHHPSFRSLYIRLISLYIYLYACVPLFFFHSCNCLNNFAGHPGFSFCSMFLWEKFL